MPNISIFKGCKQPKPAGQIDIDQYLIYVRDGHWQDTVLSVRAGRMPKQEATGVCVSGTFSYRSVSGLVEHSGYIALDFDYDDNPNFPADEIALDSFVYAMHRSIGGKGWVVYVRIEPEKHREAFDALDVYFANKYEVVVDRSGSDVSRLRFVSYDPDLVWNKAAPVFKKYLPKKQRTQNTNVVFCEDDFWRCIKEIDNGCINIAPCYHDRMMVGMAIASHYKEQGLNAFRVVARHSSDWSESKIEKRYQNYVKTTRHVTLGTFFYYCKKAGIETKSQRTRHIENVAIVHKKKIGLTGGAVTPEAAKEQVIKILSEVDKIEGEDVQSIVNQVFEQKDDEQSEQKETKGEILQKLIEFVRSYPIRFNEVTNGYELDGVPMTDRDFNTLLIAAKRIFGDRKVSKELLYTVVGSEITPKFNPFKEYFTSRANLKPSGVVDEFLDCINLKTSIITQKDFKRIFVKKWLLSIVASAFGTYSVMCLVLTGRQGISKTRFFRTLLPPDLRRYMADAKLDNLTKDDLQMLCCNLLICDDEFGGKSKREYKLFKELTSKDKIMIRPPYGRNIIEMQRYAVLCGTSNEEDVINDPTGNRRIIAANVESIDYERLEKIDRDALFLELYHEFVTIKDGWMLNDQDIKLLQNVTFENEQANPEIEALLRFFSVPDGTRPTRFMSNTDIKDYLETRSRQIFNATRLGIALKKIGFKRISKKIGGVTLKLYEVVENQTFTTDPAPF